MDQDLNADRSDYAETKAEKDFLTQLASCAADLTQQARDGKLTVAYGRDAEADELLRALASPGQLFPMLIGQARGGKTAIAHQAVNKMVRGECPPTLKDAQVFEVTPARLISGLGGMSQWVGRVNDFFNSLAESGVILFLRDFHTGHGLGQNDEDSSDFIEVISDLLQGAHPHLFFEARTRLLDVLNTKGGNLYELLSPIQVNALSKDDAARVVQHAAEDLEVIHEVEITQDACDEAMELALRFQVNQLLPGSALDMLKDTLSTADKANKVNADVVRKRFTGRSGLPDFLVSDEVPYDEPETRRMLTQRVFGQEAAIEAVLRTVALVRARLNNPIKPMGVFLFLGPTGVGKTELVKALAQIVFGGQERIVRFNMADYNNEYTAAERLFGDPYGRTEALKQGELYRRLTMQPFAVLLLDEFEKAAPNVYQRFLQLFDEGLLINAINNELNLRNSIIVLTSNLGAKSLNHHLGFRVRDPMEQAEADILKLSEEYFRPEFINRLDAVCFFKPLSRSVIRQIAQRAVQEVIGREGITRQQLRIGVDDSVIDLIVERGYDLRFGARYLKRVIERSITYPLARQIARKRLQPGALVRLVARNNEVVVGVIEETEEERSEVRGQKPDGSAQSAINSYPSHKTVKELRAELDGMKPRIERMFEQHDIAALRERVSAMMDRIGDPDFWREPQEAAAQIETMNTLSQRVDQAENVRRMWERGDDALKRMTANTTTRRGVINKGALVEVNQIYRELARELPLVETMLHLRDEQDQASAFITVRAVDVDASPLSVEWMRDLTRMYANWAQGRGFSVSVLNESASEAVLNIGGFGAHALLKGEAGLHRLVRQMSNKKTGDLRTSVFARIEVLPDLPAQRAPDFKIESKPIRENGAIADKLTRQYVFVPRKDGPVMTWRNGLATDEMEQHVRRFVAALWAAAQASSAQPATPENEDDGPVAIADQVRVYTLYKQQSVRDLRTKRTSTQPKKILAGALDEFLLAYLEMSAG